MHAAVAAHLLGDRPLVDAVCRDFAASPLGPREKALFAYLAKLIDTPSEMAAGDAAALRAAGWSDGAIYDAVTVCSLFAFFNRWIDGTGVTPPPPGFYEERLKKFGDRGYAPA